jgi:uncharacterized protein Yka (UPF0111/DUF47 family)
LAFSLIPKEEKFFDLFEEAADNVLKAAHAFLELVSHWSPTSEKIKLIRDLEHEGDRMTHEVIDKLNRVFITPLDREDIHSLTTELDDVIDIIQSTMDRMLLFQIASTTPALIKMVEVLVQSVEVIGKAIRSLRDLAHTRRTLDFCIEANRLENEGDACLAAALKELFANPTDVLQVIKWKEIYEATEFATDKCEDIANIIEGIVVKNA